MRGYAVGRYLAFLLMLLAATAATAAAAATTSAFAAEPTRAGIETERRAIEARWLEAQAACRQRFAETACVDEAKNERRKSLAVQRDAQLRLDDIERKQRANDRRASLAQKQAEAASRVAPQVTTQASQARAIGRAASSVKRPAVANSTASSASAASAGAMGARASKQASSSPSAAGQNSKPHAVARLGGSAEDATARAARAQERREEGQLRREKIARRNVQREAQRASDPRRGAALPLPSASSAAR